MQMRLRMLPLILTTAPATNGSTQVVLVPTAAANAAGVTLLDQIAPRNVDVGVAPVGSWGDANGDDAVNIVDAQQIARFGVGPPAVARVNTPLYTGPNVTTVPIAPLSPAVAECAAPKPGWIWCDDFETNRLASYFEYVNVEGRFVRASGVGVAGSMGMSARYQVAAQAGPGQLHLAFGQTPDPYFRPVDAGTAKYREIYWRLYIKHPTTWVGGGPDKMSRAISFASNTWAEAMIAHVWDGNPGNDQLVIDPASGTDAAGTLKTAGYNDNANLRWLGAAQSTTNIFSAANLGKWMCLEVHVRLNDAGQSNGVFDLWINDSLEANRSGLNWVGSYSAYGINALFFENYWNDGSPVEQTRYWDNIVVSTQRIGC